MRIVHWHRAHSTKIINVQQGKLCHLSMPSSVITCSIETSCQLQYGVATVLALFILPSSSLPPLFPPPFLSPSLPPSLSPSLSPSLPPSLYPPSRCLLTWWSGGVHFRVSHHAGLWSPQCPQLAGGLLWHWGPPSSHCPPLHGQWWPQVLSQEQEAPVQQKWYTRGTVQHTHTHTQL